MESPFDDGHSSIGPTSLDNDIMLGGEELRRPLSSIPPTPPLHHSGTYSSMQTGESASPFMHHSPSLSVASTVFSELNRSPEYGTSSKRFDTDDELSDEDEGRAELLSLDSSTDTISGGVFQAPKDVQPRRHKSMANKQVKLVRGNLVLDCPVPTKLYSFLPRRDHDEFTYMRYTAATTDPDEFIENGFTLRPAIYGREIQLCICITMYNEDEIAFTRTMHSVMKNIAHLCSRNKSRVWGKDGWKKVVVTIVADGRLKTHPRILNVLAAMGVFQAGIAKNYVNGKEVKAHIFEYTTQVSIDSNLKFQSAEKGIVPVQVIFCLKEKNAKKINSHRWFFNAFCKTLNPNICVMLDVGTRPGTKSIYHLWKAFDADSNIGGACGEIKAMTGKAWSHLLNPIVAAQNFEYKISNILDKPMESMFGYISVLPGALSAYRYHALRNLPDGTGPLNTYFKGEFLHGSDTDVFTSNMYLAEDRILCWELVAKRGEKWLLRYVKQATGETDVPNDVAEFVSQRRRWLNGALFAGFYAQTHFTQIWKTDHSVWRKIMLHIEFIYQGLSLIFTFFSLGNFYLAFYFLAGSLAASGNSDLISGNGALYAFLVIKYIAICTIGSQFIISLGNRPQGSKHMFLGSMIILGFVGAYATGCAFYFVSLVVKQHNSDAIDLGNNTFTNIVVSLLSTYGIYAIMSILYLDPWHIFTCALQYFLLVPFYLCTLQIYAFCNTHDVTWGTKGENVQKPDLGSAFIVEKSGQPIVEIDMPAEQVDIDMGFEDALTALRERAPLPPPVPDTATVIQDYYRDVRSRVVLFWMMCNLILVLILTQIYGDVATGNNVYLKIILWSVAVLAAIRALGSFAFLCQFALKYLVETKNRLAYREGLTGTVAQ